MKKWVKRIGIVLAVGVAWASGSGVKHNQADPNVVPDIPSARLCEEKPCTPPVDDPPGYELIGGFGG